jgi:hypothetical protein
LNYTSVPTYASTQIGHISTSTYPATEITLSSTANQNIGGGVALPSVGVWFLTATGKIGINNNGYSFFNLFFNNDEGVVGRQSFYLALHGSYLTISGVYKCTQINSLVRIALNVENSSTTFNFAANAFTITAVRIA